jgi:hypothetical protein
MASKNWSMLFFFLKIDGKGETEFFLKAVSYPLEPRKNKVLIVGVSSSLLFGMKSTWNISPRTSHY